ncbi:hypothetical protein QZH41_014395, partial [Actinostola sp. cb2023]
YELLQTGQLNEEEVRIVPDLYVKNARQTFVRLRKERDFHRMHHKRVVQEKNKLITDMRRLKKHYASYEPTLVTLKHKYEVIKPKHMRNPQKPKMATTQPNDVVYGPFNKSQVAGLQSTLHQVGGTKEQLRDGSAGVDRKVKVNQPRPAPPPQRTAEYDVTQTAEKRHPKDSEFPVDTRVNPMLNYHKGPSAHLTRSGGFRLTHTVNAHSMPVSGLALHPRKQVLATVSDDRSWKMWAIPSGEIIMTGEGHKDWISDCDFHPGGARLATSSGDSSIKIWDFSKAECVTTFSDHTHAVWSCSWHTGGDFLASCSMDSTSKIWDLNRYNIERCRFTLRGHADSVNSIVFLPYSNTLLTSSADKTLSLWDARTGLCAQTFYGHMHACNQATFNLK